MGYETTVMIGWVSEYPQDKEAHFLREASVNLCKTGYDGEICKLSQEKRPEGQSLLYWYEGKEDEVKMTEDCYGKEFKLFEVSEIVKALEKDNEEEDGYHRFKWALSLLKSMRDNKSMFNMKVILFGH